MDISLITRSDIVAYLLLSEHPFHGNLDIVSFLKRIWDLSLIKSTDLRHSTAAGDIYQHMISFNDWDSSFLLYDYMKILECDDEKFLLFLETCLHPLVISDDERINEMLTFFNAKLETDNYHIEAIGHRLGRPLFRVSKKAVKSQPVKLIASRSVSTEEKTVYKVKVLFLAANPIGTDRLKLDEEIRAITEKVYASEYRDYLKVESSWAIRPDDLLQSFNKYKPHIVHFSGHGSQAGELILVDNTGSPKAVSTMALKALFTTFKDNIQVVILNACYSRSQAIAITEVINCVVGMNDAIGDEAAINFAASFYRALGFGRSVQEAFDQGKVALLLDSVSEENTPELLVRPRVNPSQIFLIEQPIALVQPPRSVRQKGQFYMADEKVRHDTFGEGVVVDSILEGGIEYVTVQFKVGRKRLHMGFTNLEKLG